MILESRLFALCAPPSLLILTRHIAEVHEKKNHNDAEPKHEKPIKCSLCSYKFDHKEHLDRHIAAVHEEKKPFELAFPTGRDTATFRDIGTEVSLLSRDKGTTGQAQNLAMGRDGSVQPVKI